MTALKNLPGGLPNIHIGVISSDMGAGDGSIAGCDATGGKNGVFQYTPRGTCTATNLAPGATYISDVDGVRNYTGHLEDVFTCIAALGESGCGFERQFAAITRALGADGQPPPPENQGFLRPDAYLAIVMITNEDDCSATSESFYDTSSNTERGVAARAAVELPLQRVRAPVRRRRPRAASRPATTWTRPSTTATACRTKAADACSSVAGHREPPQGAQGRRRSDHGRGDHRGSDAVRWCAGRRRAPRTRRVAPPSARGR